MKRTSPSVYMPPCFDIEWLWRDCWGIFIITPDLPCLLIFHTFSCRCGMCRRDFCDSCLASPYHDGLSCEDNDRPDCLYCGEKVHT